MIPSDRSGRAARAAGTFDMARDGVAPGRSIAFLRTARMLLRPWHPDDAALLAPVLESNVAHLTPWIPAHVATPLPVPELAERLRGFANDFAADRAWRYALLTHDERRVLGEADLFPRSASGRVTLREADRLEIGYWLDSAATGQGLATEAVIALLEIGVAMPGIGHVEIRCDANNAASAAVPRRLGFALASTEGTLQVWSRANVRTDAQAPTVRS